MNYKRLYRALVTQNKTYGCYTEKHHIIPRCVGGRDEEDNLVELSAREHFVAHWLLTKIYPDNIKLKYAFGGLLFKNGKRLLTSWEFERLRLNHMTKKFTKEHRANISRAKKGKKTGQIPWNKGKKMSEDHKAKLSKALKGKMSGEKHPLYGTKHSKETRTKMSEARIQRVISVETRNKTSKTLKGREFSDEHRAKLKAAWDIRRQKKSPTNKIGDF